MTSLLERARKSGTCPPSLLSDPIASNEDGFEEAALRTFDAAEFQLTSDMAAAENFSFLLQAFCSEKMTSDSEDPKKNLMVQRRAILLAVVAKTPSDSPTLEKIIAEGYLSAVKLWLDDVLQHSVGSVDFLLHLLSCIVNLPVTKNAVKESGMGKAIGTIEKHPICKGTPNEAAISKRVQDIKEAWNASVKARKATTESTTISDVSNTSSKRANEESNDSQSSSKKAKLVPPTAKKSSSFSSLLKKVSGPPKESPTGDKEDAADDKKAQKKSKRVKWSDHFGGELSISQFVEGGEVNNEYEHDTSVTWSDRKMRDRLREKELLATARKAKLMDDDDDDMKLDTKIAATMVPTTAWRVPSLLPERSDVAPANLVSQEVITQNLRKQTVLAAVYASENDVPSRPSPLTEVEQALDMTSQSSAIVQDIPFFIPEPVAAMPEPTPVPAYQPLSVPAYDPGQGYQSFVAAQNAGATPEFVQALGLPLFLVGQNVQALQTLASSPGLLTNFVDASGAYDQARLMGLVQTLSGTTGSQPPTSLPYGTATPMYAAPAPVAPYGHTQTFMNQPRGAPRGSEGNLHVSGYGPSTSEAEIIDLFSPYVQVDQVVMKGTFAFVNTSDPLNAQRAKEALTGTLLGGMPIRINPAQRKSSTTPYTSSTVAPGGNLRSSTNGGSYGQPGAIAPLPSMNTNHVVSDPGSAGPINVDLARDDRGNPATKNLFVAGYGPTTQEQEIRDLFGQYVQVVGVVSKGSFTFVNTTDREAAVRARQALSGTMLNGGVMRINFAKETGRLGTSFDLTYGQSTGPNAQIPMNANAGQSYYGRGY